MNLSWLKSRRARRSSAVRLLPSLASRVEALELRTLLSADFAVTDRLLLDGFTQVTDENLTIRENGQAYEFVLSEGVWIGVDGGGVTGSGTVVLSVDKAAAAGLAAGIDVDASGVTADMELQTADFSSLAGGLEIGGAGAVTQAAGRALTISSVEIAAVSFSLAGTVTGGEGAVALVATQSVALVGASVSTTSGSILLSGNRGGLSESDVFAGVTLSDAIVETTTGAVMFSGRGGDRLPAQGTAWYGNHGVHVRGTSRITSTGGNAAPILLLGEGGLVGGHGIFLEGDQLARSVLSSAYGDVIVIGTGGGGTFGGHGVAASRIFKFASTGTGSGAAAITVDGRAGLASRQSDGVFFDNVRLDTIDGDVTITGRGGGRDSDGVYFRHAFFKASGTMGRGRISVTGTAAGGEADETRGAYGVEWFGSTLETVTHNVDMSGQGSGYGYENVGVHVIGEIVSSGTGPHAATITIAGAGGAAGLGGGVAIVNTSTDIQSTDGRISVTGRAAPGARFALHVGSGQLLSLGAADISLVAASNGPEAATLTVLDRVLARNAGVELFGDTIELGDSPEIYEGAEIEAARATVAPSTAGRRIDLGGIGSASALGLTDAELDRFRCGVLQIGNLLAGDIHLVGRVDAQVVSRGTPYPRYATLSLVTSSGVHDSTPLEQTDLVAERIWVHAQFFGMSGDGDIELGVPGFAAAVAFTADVSGGLFTDVFGDLLLGSVAARTIKIDVTDGVSIRSKAILHAARLDVDESDLPRLLLRNGGPDAVRGAFAGLPEGAVVRSTAAGVVRITYRGGDGNDVALVTNSIPVAAEDRFGVSEEGILEGDLLANDSDREADPLEVTAVNGDMSAVGRTIQLPSGALLTLNADGSFTYDPNGEFDRLPPGGSQVDSFTYTVSDGYGGTATASVIITVFGVGATDLIAYSGGDWQVSISNDLSFETSVWAAWADVAWDALRQADVNGDGLTDVVGLIDGAWWVGISDGTRFITTRWAKWQNRDWQNVVLRDLDGDGQADLLTRLGGNWWAALSTGTAFATPSVWTSWKDVSWRVFVDDLNADGQADLLGFYRGEWWGALSNGNGFDAAARRARWADVEWDSIGTLHLDADRQVDVFGLYHGEWFTGHNVGDRFETSLRTRWVDLPWQNVRVGDFNGDSFDDLAAYYAGEWWVTLTSTTGGAGKMSRWAVWKNADWQDIRVGDFNGDGRTDLVGRMNGGLWVATSNGERFSTSRWGGWSDRSWQAVGSAEVDGLPTVGPLAEEPEFSAFWSSATEDDELAASLMSVS